MTSIKPTTPCVYELVWTKHNKRYIGMRYGEGVTLSTVGNTYFGSGEAVQQFHKEHGDPDLIIFHKTYETVTTFDDWVRIGTEAHQYERDLITRQRACIDDDYLNNHNGFGSNPCFKHSDKTKTKMINIFADPTYKDKQSATMKQDRSTLEYKERHSKMMKERHSDPEYKASISSAIATAFTKPEVKARHLEAVKKRNADPAFKAKQSAGLKRAFANPEIRARRSEILRDPDVRARRLASLKKTWSNPELRERKSAEMTGLLYWNNGLINKRSREQPGPDFVRGRLKKKR